MQNRATHSREGKITYMAPVPSLDGSRVDYLETEGRDVQEERERLAGDLHDTAGQTFLAILFLCREWAAEAPPNSPWGDRMSRLVDLARQGRREIHEAIRDLAFTQRLGGGLIPAVRELTRSFEVDSGIPVLLDLEGSRTRLGAEAEGALLRVAHQALANAWRHSRCAAVRVELLEVDDALMLRITDDGTGLGRRWDERGPGLGMTGMRRAVESLGGSFTLTGIRPHGLRVTACVPIRGKT